MFGWIALAITAVCVSAVAWRVDNWRRDWTENTAELHPDAPREELRPVVLDVGLERAVQQITDWAGSQPAWDVQAVETPDDQSAKIHLTRTTRVFHFLDDINVSLRSGGDHAGVVVEARSQSRVGKGDLGQNPRNLIELTNGLRGR